MPRPDTDLFALLRTLATEGVDFIVTGGVGAVLHGAPIATFDLDLVHSRDPGNTDRLAAALASLGAYYREHPEKRHVPGAVPLSGPGHHLLMTDAGPLDLLGTVTGGRGYEDLVTYAVDVVIEPGLSIKVLGLSMIIRLKEELGGEKDLASLPILRRTLEERDRTG